MVLHEIVEGQEAAVAAWEREAGETAEVGASEQLVAAEEQDLLFEELGSSLVQMETSFDYLLGIGLQMRNYFALKTQTYFQGPLMIYHHFLWKGCTL